MIFFYVIMFFLCYCSAQQFLFLLSCNLPESKDPVKFLCFHLESRLDQNAVTSNLPTAATDYSLFRCHLAYKMQLWGLAKALLQISVPTAGNSNSDHYQLLHLILPLLCLRIRREGNIWYLYIPQWHCNNDLWLYLPENRFKKQAYLLPITRFTTRLDGMIK